MSTRLPSVVATCVALLLGGGSAGAEEVEGDRVADPVWGVVFYAAGYQRWEDHPLREQSNFVAAGSWDEAGCGLRASLFAIPVERGSTAGQCRIGFAGNPEPLAARADVDQLAVSDSPVAWTRFDQALEAGVVMNQLYGYWTRDETCFELHVSSENCPAFSDGAMPVLQSLELSPRPEVNVETVSIARAIGTAPDDWRVHEALASTYLYEATPIRSDRARRYYTSALALGGDSLHPEDEWVLRAGLGLSWLVENRGADAVAPLRRAVDLATGWENADQALGESLYNLACALSLSGELEESCAVVAELLDLRSRRERKRTVKEMRADPQLRALLETPCFEALSAER